MYINNFPRFFLLELLVWWIAKFLMYRKWGWFGTNFTFGVRLRRYRVLYCTANAGGFLILIWTSFSSFIIGRCFYITLFFYAKNLRFLGFRFCGWFGTTVFLGELKDFDAGFFHYYIWYYYLRNTYQFGTIYRATIIEVRN